jgi:hypothetical protein
MDNTEFKVLCPYCKAVWSAEMLEELEVEAECDTCDYGSYPTGTIDIYCTNCKKLIYRKEIS